MALNGGDEGIVERAASRLIGGLERLVGGPAFAPFLFATACCARDELLLQGMIDRHEDLLGPLRRVPQQADLLIVSGPLTQKAAPALQRVLRQMPESRRVLAWGSCAIDGGIHQGPMLVGPLASLVRVDVAVRGCPPGDDEFREALLRLRALAAGERAR